MGREMEGVATVSIKGAMPRWEEPEPSEMGVSSTPREAATLARALLKASAVWKRPSGSLARVIRMISLRAGNAGVEFDGRARGLVEMAGEDGVVAVALEGFLAGDHFVQGDAERIDIGAGVELLALDLFGRHVVKRADDVAGFGEGAVGGHAGDAEVHQLDAAVGRKHDVGRLDVAMDDAARMGVGEGGEGLVGGVERLGDRQAADAHEAVEGGAFDELHDHDHLVANALSGAQGGDVGMFETGGDFDFAAEALDQLGVFVEAGEENLHGVDTVRDGVADLIDLAHAAGSENGENLVIAGHLPDGEIHMGMFLSGRLSCRCGRNRRPWARPRR